MGSTRCGPDNAGPINNAAPIKTRSDCHLTRFYDAFVGWRKLIRPTQDNSVRAGLPAIVTASPHIQAPYNRPIR